MTGRVLGVSAIGLTVSDVDASRAYYEETFGFVPDAPAVQPAWTRLVASDANQVRVIRLRLGAQRLDLAQFDPPGTPYPQDSRACDLWFQHFAIVCSPIGTIYDRLDPRVSPPISIGGPATLPPAAGAVVAYKFRDPDGRPLELLQFPLAPSKPAATLGIDHSAISVADVDRGIAFYRLLGFTVTARQVNSGPEQDRLDGLSGVSVDVVALTPAGAATPHLELLGYRHPRGRAQNPARAPHDIADTRLVLRVEHLDDLVLALRSARHETPDPVSLGAAERGLMLRDPDGHALILVEAAERD